MTSCEEAAVLITALIDGELGLEEAGRVRAHLDKCSDCASRAELEQRLKGFLRDRLAAVETPPGLRGRILAALGEGEPITTDRGEGGRKARKGGGNIPGGMWWLPLLVIVMLIASMGGMLLVTETGEMEQDRALDPFQVRLVAIHRAATGAGVYPIRSHEVDELAAWFSEHAGRSVKPPSLAGLGMEPVGGRILSMDGHDVPMAVYRDPSEARPPLVLVLGGPGFPLEMGGGEPLADGGGMQADFQGVRLLWLDRNGAPWMVTTEGTPEFLAQVAAALQGEGDAG